MYEIVWLKRILKDLGIPITNPILLYFDNMSSIHLARNQIFHDWTKHIEVHCHFIQERVLAGDVDLQHICTNIQTTDIFTKAMGADKPQKFTMNLGLLTTNQPSFRGSMDKESSDMKSNEHRSEPPSEATVDSKLTRRPMWTNYLATKSCIWRGVLRIKLNFPSVGIHLSILKCVCWESNSTSHAWQHMLAYSSVWTPHLLVI